MTCANARRENVCPLGLNTEAAVADELEDRVRRLDAERMRPDPPGDPTVEELLTRLIGTIHTLWRTPPDKERE